MAARSTKQPNVLCSLAVVQVYCHGCKAKNMKWWKAAMMQGRPAHCTCSVPSLSPAEATWGTVGCCTLVPLPAGLICAGCFWIVQEQSQLRGGGWRMGIAFPPCFSVLSLCLSVSLVFAQTKGRLRGDEVSRVNTSATNKGISKSKLLRWSEHSVLSDTDTFLCLCLHVFVFVAALKGSRPGLKEEGIQSCFPRSRQEGINNIKTAGVKKEMWWHFQTVSSYKKGESVS